MFTPSDVNLDRVLSEIETLSNIGAQPSGGMTRYTFSEEHQRTMHQTAGWMDTAGFDVYFDRWGNLYGRTPGLDDMKCVLTGSHLDSVPNGGNYDGPLGVLSSLEATRLIVERGVKLKKPIEVVSFIEEEGARFSGLLGSRLAAGKLTETEIEALADRHGNHFLDVLNDVTFKYPIKQDLSLVDRIDTYLELHIEQGHRLEDAGVPIGVVTAIASPNFVNIQFTGRSDHAGATAYEDRHDTLLAAAEFIVQLREIGETEFADKGHMTVGYIEAHPNVMNVIAGRTAITVDFRAADDDIAAEMNVAIVKILDKVCAKQGVQYMIRENSHIPAAITPDYIAEAVAHGAEQAGVGSQSMVSWAAHDAMVVAEVCDAGMIFVPCRDGRSHTPEEYTRPEDIAAGIATMANTLVQLAG